MDLVRAMGLKDINWLDTGCGTGTLCSRVLEERDDVRFLGYQRLIFTRARTRRR